MSNISNYIKIVPSKIGANPL